MRVFRPQKLTISGFCESQNPHKYCKCNKNMPYYEERRKNGLNCPLLLYFCLDGGFKLMRKESDFQHSLIKNIKARFPGAIVIKNDPHYIQGFPDLTVFWNSKWAVLECKRSSKDSHQPNQDYYIRKMDKMSYAAFIYPENEKEVLNEMERSFKARGASRSISS